MNLFLVTNWLLPFAILYVAKTPTLAFSSTDSKVKPYQVRVEMDKMNCSGNGFWRALSDREKELIAIVNVLHPLKEWSDGKEEVMDVSGAQCSGQSLWCYQMKNRLDQGTTLFLILFLYQSSKLSANFPALLALSLHVTWQFVFVLSKSLMTYDMIHI